MSKSTAAADTRVYTPAEIKAEGITLELSPVASIVQCFHGMDPDEVIVSFERLEAINCSHLLPDNAQALSDADEVLGGENILLKDLKGFKEIPFVTPLCSQLTLFGSVDGKGKTTSKTGVKLWGALKQYQKIYQKIDIEPDFFEFNDFSISGHAGVYANLVHGE